ncbi:MAG: hypothetical protein AMXMBFR55_11500 [Gemmatimonadota bacterium]
MIRFQTLGAIELRRDDTALATILAQPKRLALLAYLACARPAGFRSRDTILALFWPESDTERARNSLRQALHHLRRGMGEDAITTRGEREVGIDPAIVICDASRFDAAIDGGQLEEALALYQGDFLAGLHVHDAPDAERWLDDERLRRRRLAVEGARQLAEAAASSGDAEGGVRWARRALAIDPTDEGAVRRLVELLADAGDVTGALDVYADHVKRLAADFGLKPSLELTRLVQSIGERPVATTAEIAALAPGGSRGAPEGDRSGAGGAVTAALPVSVAPIAPVAPAAPAAPAAARALPAAPLHGAPGRRRWARAALGLAVLVVAIFGIRWAMRDRAERTGTTPSIAVLPFVNMSGDSGNEYLADGMTEELLNRLAQVPGLQVAARTSAFAFKGRNLPVDSIGRALRVRHVLEGSIRQAGDRWRITAQLIDAASGYHLWSDNFEASMGDVVAVQDKIGRAIVARLLVQVGTATVAAEREPRDAMAHVAVMKGWRAFRANTPEGYAAAIGHFREAIARDSSYGHAFAGLATVRHWQGYLRWAPTDSAYDEARSLAGRALALDSNLVDGWLVLGRTQEVRGGDDAVAEGHYRRAMRAAPSDPRPYSRLAPLVARAGRPDDAVALALRAVELDPASPAVYSDLANLYSTLDRPADAERAIRQALALDPGHPILLGNLALQLVRLGRFVAAESAIVRSRARAPDNPVQLGQHAFIAARLGQRDRARALADSAARLGVSRVSLATTWLALGDTARTYALLERALREGDDELPFVLDSTTFAAIRREPRFQRILEAVRTARDSR